MSNINYITETVTKVYLENKLIGEIRQVNGGPAFRLANPSGGFAYFPKGSKKHGDIFNTVAEVKFSLKE